MEHGKQDMGGYEIVKKVKEDRAAMAYSLESRVPFLDTDLVNFAVSLPPEMKMNGFTTKYVLRKWAKNRLPRFVLRRKKHGFAVPVSEWMREDLREYSGDLLLTPGAMSHEYLDPDVIRDLWEEHQKGFDHGQILYSLLILELWLRRWVKINANQKAPLRN